MRFDRRQYSGATARASERKLLPFFHVSLVGRWEQGGGSYGFNEFAKCDLMGLRFAPFGTHSLKGVPGAWQLFSVERP